MDSNWFYYEYDEFKHRLLRILGTFGSEGTTLREVQSRYEQLYIAPMPPKKYYICVLDELLQSKDIIINNYLSLVGMNSYNGKHIVARFSTIKEHYVDYEFVKRAVAYDF